MNEIESEAQRKLPVKKWEAGCRILRLMTPRLGGPAVNSEAAAGSVI